MKSEPINFIRKKSYNIPFFLSTVKAGFPSPAENYISEELDLNDYLIEHPTATFFVRVSGESMAEEGINDGDLLIVDKSLQPHNGSIVIVILDGEFTVKKFKKEGKQILLLPANHNYKPIKITNDQLFEIWGVVTSVIHQFK